MPSLVGADFKDGVLNLKIPKSEPPTDTTRRIPVSSGQGRSPLTIKERRPLGCFIGNAD